MISLVIGAGGTGSYVVPDLANILNTISEDEVMVVIDGDIVENKNLTRQAFYKEDVGKNKALTMLDRMKDMDTDRVTKIIIPKYVETTAELIYIINKLKKIYPDQKELVLICCADNTMVRYRMEMASYLVKDRLDFNTVAVIDSGNSEITGQCLVSVLDSRFSIEEDLRNNVLKVKGGKLDSMFSRLDGELEDKITYGSFELSCADSSVSSPQNIGTNMMAAGCVINSFINLLYQGTSESVQFESRYGTVSNMDRVSEEVINASIEQMLGIIDQEMSLDEGYQLKFVL